MSSHPRRNPLGTLVYRLSTTNGQDSQAVLGPVQQPHPYWNDQGNDGFELKSGLVNMIQESPFYGKASEDANAHLQNFLEVSSTINPRGTMMDNVRLRLFPFSLLGKAKTWFYTNKACSNAFLMKYFPVGKTNALRSKISGFQQLPDEAIPEAWERFQEYIAACPHHGMEE